MPFIQLPETMSTRRNENSTVSPTESRTASPRQDRDSAPSVTGPIESLIRKIGIDKVYGSPITHGETTVVPVADLRTGFGFGGGHDDQPDTGGWGGGAGLRLTPRGYLEITADGAQYRPIYSFGTLVAGGAFVGWLLVRLLSRR